MASALSLWGVLFYFLRIVKDIRIPHLVGRQTWRVLPKNSERNSPGIFMLSCIGWGLITHVPAHPPAASFAVGPWTGIWLFFGSQLRQETHNRFSRKLLPETLHAYCGHAGAPNMWTVWTNLGIAHLSVRALCASSFVYPEKGKNHCIMSVKDIVSKQREIGPWVLQRRCFLDPDVFIVFTGCPVIRVGETSEHRGIVLWKELVAFSCSVYHI